MENRKGACYKIPHERRGEPDEEKELVYRGDEEEREYWKDISEI